MRFELDAKLIDAGTLVRRKKIDSAELVQNG